MAEARKGHGAGSLCDMHKANGQMKWVIRIAVVPFLFIFLPVFSLAILFKDGIDYWMNRIDGFMDKIEI